MIENDMKFRQMVEILEIQDEEDNIEILEEWIEQSGMEEVYRKVLKIQERATRE